MQQNHHHTTDSVVKNERRGVWLGLVVVLALVATMVMDTDTRRALLTGLAVAVVFVVAWLTRSGGCRSSADSQANRDAVMHDELRQIAMARASQWAFFAVLTTLTAFCVASNVVPFELPGQMLAALAVALGATVFLVLFLVFDRA